MPYSIRCSIRLLNPILGMSGLLDAPNIWRHLNLTTWLTKPFKNDELLHALHAALHPAK